MNFYRNMSTLALLKSLYWTNRYQNTIIIKNKFDVFTGNLYTDRILKALNPKIIIVYGVATNVCVNFAVLGLAQRGYKVVVVKDAIKELPNLPLAKIFNTWKELGVDFETTKNIENVIKFQKK